VASPTLSAPRRLRLELKYVGRPGAGFSAFSSWLDAGEFRK
jgi:hypothetical protein